MKRKATALILIGILLVLTLITGCKAETEASETDIIIPEPGSLANQIEYVGEGSNLFLLEVTDDDGKIKYFSVTSNEDTIGAALLEVGLIEGDVSDFGLMVTVVNGLRADYEKDGAYWAFYINGEYATAGVDSTEIKPGRVYSLVYEKG